MHGSVDGDGLEELAKLLMESTERTDTWLQKYALVKLSRSNPTLRASVHTASLAAGAGGHLGRGKFLVLLLLLRVGSLALPLERHQRRAALSYKQQSGNAA
jgi:hypothetical protein